MSQSDSTDFAASLKQFDDDFRAQAAERRGEEDDMNELRAWAAKDIDKALAQRPRLRAAPRAQEIDSSDEDESILDPDVTSIRDEMTRKTSQQSVTIVDAGPSKTIKKRAKSPQAQAAPEQPPRQRLRMTRESAPTASSSRSPTKGGRRAKGAQKSLQDEAAAIQKLKGNKWFDFVRGCPTVGAYVKHISAFPVAAPGKALQNYRIVLVNPAQGDLPKNWLDQKAALKVNMLFLHGAVVQPPEDFTPALDENDEDFTTHVIPLEDDDSMTVESVLPLLGNGLRDVSELGRLVHIVRWDWIAQRIKTPTLLEAPFEIGSSIRRPRPPPAQPRRRREVSTPPPQGAPITRRLSSAVSYDVSNYRRDMR